MDPSNLLCPFYRNSDTSENGVRKIKTKSLGDEFCVSCRQMESARQTIVRKGLKCGEGWGAQQGALSPGMQKLGAPWALRGLKSLRIVAITQHICNMQHTHVGYKGINGEHGACRCVHACMWMLCASWVLPMYLTLMLVFLTTWPFFLWLLW